MRATLVCPRFVPTYWSYESSLRLAGKRCLLPPLGLITVASLMPSHWRPRPRRLEHRVPHRSRHSRLGRGHGHGDARPARVAARGAAAVPKAGSAHRGGRSLRHRRTPQAGGGRGLLVPGRGRRQSGRVLRSLRGGPRAQGHPAGRSARSQEISPPALRPPEARLLLPHVAAVLARLSLPLRVLRHPGAARPQPAHQEPRPDRERAGRDQSHRLRRHGLLRRRQLHRQEEVRARPAALRREVAERQSAGPSSSTPRPP